MESIEHGAANVVGEAFDELVGRSKRSWALVLVAFLLGAVATAVLAIKYSQRGASEQAGGPEANDAVTPSGTQPSKVSAWTRRRDQIVHTDAMMRARVGRFGSRLNVRRHAEASQPPS
jgi:hypothetical protein